MMPNVAFGQQKAAGSTVPISKSLEKKFRRDAARLALRSQAAEKDMRFQPIGVPAALYRYFYKMLVGIYQQDSIGIALDKCNIHTFPDPSIDHLVVVYDNAAEWTKPLQMGQNQTTNLQFEALLRSCQLKIEQHVDWDDKQKAVTIRSRKPLNIASIANQFMQIEGIIKVEMNVPKTTGNDIQAEKIEDGWEIKYMLRFGSHSNSGVKTHQWVYRYYDNGKFEYVGEEGAPIPDWMRCKP